MTPHHAWDDDSLRHALSQTPLPDSRACRTEYKPRYVVVRGGRVIGSSERTVDAYLIAASFGGQVYGPVPEPERKPAGGWRVLRWLRGGR